MESLTDNRRTYTFYVDDAVLDVFGPRIGAYGVAVYTLLARHAKHKQAFPSYKLIQQKLGIGRMTVVRTLTALQQAGLITIDTRKSRVGDYDTKLYTLCDLSSFRAGGTCEVPPGLSEVPPGLSEVPPGLSEVPGVVPVGYQGGTCEVPEGISLKGSHLKDPDPPIVPPGGPVGVKARKVAPQGTRKKTYYPTDPTAQATLRSLVFDAAFDAWVQASGLTLDVADQWDRFGRKALAKGYQYVDWRQAFMNWLTSPYQAQPQGTHTHQQRKAALRAWAEKGMQESQHGS